MHAHYKDSAFSIVFTISSQNTIAHQYGVYCCCIYSCLLLFHLLHLFCDCETRAQAHVAALCTNCLVQKFKVHTNYEIYITCTVQILNILVWGWMFECEQIFGWQIFSSSYTTKYLCKARKLFSSETGTLKQYKEH